MPPGAVPLPRRRELRVRRREQLRVLEVAADGVADRGAQAYPDLDRFDRVVSSRWNKDLATDVDFGYIDDSDRGHPNIVKFTRQVEADVKKSLLSSLFLGPASGF